MSDKTSLLQDLINFARTVLEIAHNDLFSLLFGTIVLFAIFGIIMYLSIKDIYSGPDFLREKHASEKYLYIYIIILCLMLIFLYMYRGSWSSGDEDSRPFNPCVSKINFVSLDNGSGRFCASNAAKKLNRLGYGIERKIGPCHQVEVNIECDIVSQPLAVGSSAVVKLSARSHTYPPISIESTGIATRDAAVNSTSAGEPIVEYLVDKAVEQAFVDLQQSIGKFTSKR